MKRLLPILAVIAALSFVSCNHEGLDPEVDGESSISESSFFWGVVGQLVDYRDITPDYKGKTFTPIIGSPDNGDASVRVVSVNTLAAAVERYNTLTDAGITETTSSHTWQHKAVGSLTWNLSGDNTCWATVDVNIPSVPSLHKIIYRSPEQGDVNGSVGDDGSAYYRFGDVIKQVRPEDHITEYWICVRPAFGPEKKGNAHFVCVSPLPEENIWPYNSSKADQKGKPWVASNRMEYAFPDNIRKDHEWTQDLVEMLYAIMYPEQWYANIQTNSGTGTFGGPTGLPIFGGFHSNKIQYHNVEFWKGVQRQWKSKNLVRDIFGVTYEDLESAINPDNLEAAGLHFLYYGFGWSTSVSNKPKLYQIHYTHGTDKLEKNMHKATTKTVQSQVVVPNTFEESNTNYPFNIKTETNQMKPYIQKPNFFGDNHPRWIIRFATGEELSSTRNFDNQQPIPGYQAAGEVYRYYRDVFPEKNLTSPPEITSTEFTGVKPHYHWGGVYQDEQGAKWFVINPAGLRGVSDASKERSFYAELVSFDMVGLKDAQNHSRFTNLPNLELAIRMYLFLFRFSNQGMLLKGNGNLDTDLYDGPPIKNIRDYADVDFTMLMQCVNAQNGNPRSPSMLCSIAYDDGVSQTTQPLLRCIMDIQNKGNQPKFYCSTKYPAQPDEVTQFVQNYSDTKIMLQDIADQEKVTRYAPDSYAKQALFPMYYPATDGQPRSIRTDTDDRAKDVRNYYYDKSIFNSYAYAGDMWNEPILVFRYTRVWDRGETDFKTTTVDGHTLTFLHDRLWPGGAYEELDYDEYDDNLSGHTLVFDSLIGLYLNGQPHHMLTWQEIDNATINSK